MMDPERTDPPAALPAAMDPDRMHVSNDLTPPENGADIPRYALIDRETPAGRLVLPFCWAPPGVFWMGNRGGEWTDEDPLHRVKITQGFWLGRTPVTQRQWRVVMGGVTKRKYRALLARVIEPPGDLSLPKDLEDPSHFKGADRPVEQVGWWDAVVYCERLRDLGAIPDEPGGWRVRMPTEAEWEYACRAGTETEYFPGDGEGALSRAGWYDGNSESETHPVAERAANGWGLHDMHGNVWEWCWDVWDDTAYGKHGDPAVDPVLSGPTDSQRVRRGGSWFVDPDWCRASFRYWGWPNDRYGNIGFRVCLVRGSSWRRPDGADVVGAESEAGAGAPSGAGAKAKAGFSRGRNLQDRPPSVEIHRREEKAIGGRQPHLGDRSLYMGSVNS